MLPNDEAEQDRLDLQHHLFRLTADGALYLAPIPKDVHNVLDAGCGTGIVRFSWPVILTRD
jgi:tRNA1(Val) A37 N6-methylase TrmN6